MIVKPIAATLTLLFVFSTAHAAEKTKILLIGKDRDHPPASHEYMHECEFLARCLRQTPGVETVVSNGWPKDPAVLKDVKAIAMYTASGGDVLLKGPHRKQVEELMNAGVGLAAIHFSVAANEGEHGEQFLHTLGGWFGFRFSLFGVHRSKLTQADPKHPVCRGWKDYDLRDEYYWHLRFLPRTQPIATAVIAGKEYPMMWVFERAKSKESKGGRSFGTVLGHFHDNFGHKPFRQALVNGILWTANVEIPADGAPCEIAEKDMELPPDPRGKK